MINLLLILLMLLPTGIDYVDGVSDSSEIRRITYYHPGEDNWGNAVADPEIMRHGDPGIESWGYPWVAVNDLKAYPFGTLIYIEGVGFKFAHDHCPQPNTVDIRVTEETMECFKAKVWVIFRRR